MNLKQHLNYNKSSSTNNMNLNYIKLNNNNNNFDIYDQTRNKFSMKFFEKLNMNNHKISNSKGIKYSNINDMNNNISSKNAFNNIKKEVIQIYNKEKNHLNVKNNEKHLITKIKGKKFIGLGNNIESKNNVLSSSYSNWASSLSTPSKSVFSNLDSKIFFNCSIPFTILENIFGTSSTFS